MHVSATTNNLLGLLTSALLFAAAPAQLGQAADQCTASQGLLDIPLMLQAESSWCWVASTNVLTNRLGYKNSSNQYYQQCELYNLARGTTDCCAYAHPIDSAAHPQCVESGWPWEAFEKLNPIVDSEGNALAMNWNQIQGQICPEGIPGQPFIFVDQLPTNSGTVFHTNVVKGFTEVFNSTSIQTLYVDTHYALGQGQVGPKHLDYDCGYVRPGPISSGGCGKGYDRYEDIYDIQRRVQIIPPDVTIHPRPSLRLLVPSQ
jgi:hypothetical protein